jgi:CRP/FNR family transcriptional regulator, cyclic AMP receptor protein
MGSLMIKASELEAVIAAHWRCSAEVSAIVAAHAISERFAARQLIQTAQGLSRLVSVMVAGHAQAFAYSIDGRAVMVEEFHTGDMFGDITAQASAASDEVVANTAVTAARIATPKFVSLMEQYASVAVAVAYALTRRVSQAHRKVVHMSTVSAPGRVYAELLRLGKTGADWQISPPPVLAELAMTVQSTRETVSRAVSVLEKRGIVKRDGQRLTIVAPHRLEELIY